MQLVYVVIVALLLVGTTHAQFSSRSDLFHILYTPERKDRKPAQKIPEFVKNGTSEDNFFALFRLRFFSDDHGAHMPAELLNMISEPWQREREKLFLEKVELHATRALWSPDALGLLQGWLADTESMDESVLQRASNSVIDLSMHVMCKEAELRLTDVHRALHVWHEARAAEELVHVAYRKATTQREKIACVTMMDALRSRYAVKQAIYAAARETPFEYKKIRAALQHLNARDLPSLLSVSFDVVALFMTSDEQAIALQGAMRQLCVYIKKVSPRDGIVRRTLDALLHPTKTTMPTFYELVTVLKRYPLSSDQRRLVVVYLFMRYAQKAEMRQHEHAANVYVRTILALSVVEEDHTAEQKLAYLPIHLITDVMRALPMRTALMQRLPDAYLARRWLDLRRDLSHFASSLSLKEAEMLRRVLARSVPDLWRIGPSVDLMYHRAMLEAFLDAVANVPLERPHRLKVISDIFDVAQVAATKDLVPLSFADSFSPAKVERCLAYFSLDTKASLFPAERRAYLEDLMAMASYASRIASPRQRSTFLFIASPFVNSLYNSNKLPRAILHSSLDAVRVEQYAITFIAGLLAVPRHRVPIVGYSAQVHAQQWLHTLQQRYPRAADLLMPQLQLKRPAEEEGKWTKRQRIMA